MCKELETISANKTEVEEYKGKNTKFFQLLNQVIETKYKEFNVIYISDNSFYNSNSWYDMLVIEDKKGQYINGISIPVFIRKIGFDINDIDWECDYCDEKLLKIIKNIQKRCNIIKDFNYYEQETKKYLDSNKDSLDKRIAQIVNGKWAHNDSYYNEYFRYDKDIRVFVSGDSNCPSENVVSIEYILKHLKYYNKYK